MRRCTVGNAAVILACGLLTVMCAAFSAYSGEPAGRMPGKEQETSAEAAEVSKRQYGNGQTEADGQTGAYEQSRQDEPSGTGGQGRSDEPSGTGGQSRQDEPSGTGEQGRADESSKPGGQGRQTGTDGQTGSRPSRPTMEEETPRGAAEPGESKEQEEADRPDQADEPEPSEEAGKAETEPRTPPRQKNWTVVLSEIAPVIPEGGRTYDGTDSAQIRFRWKLRPSAGRMEQETGTPDASGIISEDRRTDGEDEAGNGNGEESGIQKSEPEETTGKDAVQTGKEEPPEITVFCSAHLDSPDAGRRKVIYQFHVQMSRKDEEEGIRLTVEDPHPDLEMNVGKRLLSVRIPNGRKVFGKKADMMYIWPEKSGEKEMNGLSPGSAGDRVPHGRMLKAEVTGFVTDGDGRPSVPDGFRAPDIEVDSDVLKDESPMFQQGDKAVYRRALIMKREKDGALSGNPTENYCFCENPDEEGYHPGDVEVMAGRICRGVDYELEGNGLTEHGGMPVVRAGTAIRVRIPDGSCYSMGREKGPLLKDGEFTVTLQKTGKDGELLAESLPDRVRYRVDGQVPEAIVKITGAKEEGGLFFTGNGCLAEILPQADEESGLLRVLYRIRRLGEDAGGGGSEQSGTHGEWRNAGTGAPLAVRLQDDGVWQVEVRTEDRVGNTSVAVSGIMVVDRTEPVCSISGVSDNSSNAGSVRLVITCTDSWYRKGSARVQIRSAAGGRIPDELSREETDGKIVIRLNDFEHTREADAWYHIRVSAEDLAGNVGRDECSFSVNRYGSSFGLDRDTTDRIETFYHKNPFDVVFLETNPDEVKHPKILVLRDGKRVRGIRVKTERENRSPGGNGKGGPYRYRYTVSAGHFRKNGVYDVLLMTSDRAGNHSDTQAMNLPVRFAVDDTRPECLVSGIQNHDVYRGKKRTVVFEVRDNLSVKEAEVYLDARLLDAYQASDIRKADGVFKLTLSEKDAWQRIQIHVTDRAGNECWSEEYSVFVSEKGTVPPDTETESSAQLLAEKAERTQKDRRHPEAETGTPGNRNAVQRIRMYRRRQNADGGTQTGRMQGILRGEAACALFFSAVCFCFFGCMTAALKRKKRGRSVQGDGER